MFSTRSRVGWLALAALVTTVTAVCADAMAGPVGRNRTVITDNTLIGNQVGMVLAEADVIRGNVILDSDFFGLALLNAGGDGHEVVLERVKFSGLGGPEVQVREGADFNATVV
jgi:hypothetical protein